MDSYNDSEPIDFIRIEPIKNLKSSKISKSSAIFHPAKNSRWKKNRPLIICLLPGIFMLCIIIVLALIPVYLSKSEDSLDADFELLKNSDSVLPVIDSNQISVAPTTEKPRKTTRIETLEIMTFPATHALPTLAPIQPNQAQLLPDLQILEPVKPEHFTLKKSKSNSLSLGFSENDMLSDNLFGFNQAKKNRLKRPKNLKKNLSFK
ncbi:unnamed protein product [Brachionus calyciflorus]|uniref:Uncharacterized protein n=1 Tax=Brachionus calyciflorus TaxID=104777 RepID=A0A813QQB0_9BILA|nr:unnamed protein product [Brachionus calyciflorus]